MAVVGIIVLMILLLAGTILLALGKGKAEGEQRSTPRLREPNP